MLNLISVFNLIYVFIYLPVMNHYAIAQDQTNFLNVSTATMIFSPKLGLNNFWLIVSVSILFPKEVTYFLQTEK